MNVSLEERTVNFAAEHWASKKQKRKVMERKKERYYLDRTVRIIELGGVQSTALFNLWCVQKSKKLCLNRSGWDKIIPCFLYLTQLYLISFVVVDLLHVAVEPDHRGLFVRVPAHQLHWIADVLESRLGVFRHVRSWLCLYWTFSSVTFWIKDLTLSAKE